MSHRHLAPERLGTAVLEPSGPLEAGSLQSLTLTYTAGFHGIDDSGSLKIVHRLVSDMAPPQMDDPAAPGYTTVEASNGALLEVRWHGKQNVRPFDRTLWIRVVRGFLQEGDRIVVRYGDPRGGSPGIRLQTFCEDAFRFGVLVDAFATYQFVPLPDPPTVRLVPGPPERWKAVLPTLRRTGEPFRLCIAAEDRWGNPTDRCHGEVGLRTSLLGGGESRETSAVEGRGGLRDTAPVDGLPERVRLEPEQFGAVLDGLSVGVAGNLAVEVVAPDGAVLARSNPLRVVEEAELLPFWADLHGQSGESVGTNPARAYFRFARDRAFLDACCHQANDFQITDAFWAHLSDLTREFDQDGRFVAFPGWEWSGNTALGGDRNVIYPVEGRGIFRSSRVLVDDTERPESDAPTVEALFDRLREEEALVVPHGGGRYSNLGRGHDRRLERAVEIHSAWGTFEWLFRDALERGWRVGVTANSDGHKGRPGASWPGASGFGDYGGLTCLLAPALTRSQLWDALRRRHHYATTGVRLLLASSLTLDEPAELLLEDPGPSTAGVIQGALRAGVEDSVGVSAGGPAGTARVARARMGDIVRGGGASAVWRLEVLAPAPVERIELRDGVGALETFRPYGEADLGRRIRVVWEGAADRGRGRETAWDGGARLDGNRFESVCPINRHNPERRFEQVGPGALEWAALTTGGFGGFEAVLAEPDAGTLRVETPLGTFDTPVGDIGLEDRVWELGGVDRRLRIFRLPGVNPHRRVVVEREVELPRGRERALWACVTTEDGHRAWPSPVYVLPTPSVGTNPPDGADASAAPHPLEERSEEDP